MDFEAMMKKLREMFGNVKQGAQAIGNAAPAPDLSKLLQGMQPPGGPPRMEGPMGSFQGINTNIGGSLQSLLQGMDRQMAPVTHPIYNGAKSLYNKIFQ